MNAVDQKVLFDKIEEKLPSHASMVNELSDLLDISIDSAYRRLRGQTKVSLEEAVFLARQFGLSLDAMFHHTENSFPFQYKGVGYNMKNLEVYYREMLLEFEKADMMSGARIDYATKDIPMFQLFAFPELAAFRLFFWEKTIYGMEEHKNQAFQLEMINEKALAVGKQMMMKYIQVPSLEIWSDEVISSTINPILYYYESGLIKKRSLALHLLDLVDDLLEHIRKQAELGTKFLPSQENPSPKNNFELYYNEVTLTNNTILLQAGDKKYAYLVQYAVDYLSTDNSAFCDRTHYLLTTLSEKSVKISSQAEKFRQKYFAKMHREVDRIRDKVI